MLQTLGLPLEGQPNGGKSRREFLEVRFPLTGAGVDNCKNLGHIYVELLRTPAPESTEASGAARKAGDWDCPRCSSVVAAGTNSCDQCGYEKNVVKAGAKDSAGANWDCKACGASVYPNKANCFRCGQARGSEGVKRSRDALEEEAKPEGNWDCTACGASVFPNKPACYRCGTARPSKDGNWDCYACGASVFATKLICYRCHAPRKIGPAGNWDCTSCGASVFPNKSNCFRCGQPRPAPVGRFGMPMGGGGVGGQNWDCSGCGASVFPNKTACFRCHNPRFESQPDIGAQRGAGAGAAGYYDPQSSANGSFASSAGECQ